jgi:Flp pilus assembly protein CpaB
LALLAGILTVLLVLNLVQSLPDGSAPSPDPSGSEVGTIVIANTFVTAGTQLGRDQLSVQRQPRETIPPGAANSPDQLIGKRALDPLYRGEPILLARVSNGGGRGPVLVAPGRTVFALPLDPTHAVGGAIAAGDVISIIGPASAKRDDPLTIIARQVHVLGIAGQSPFGAAPAPGVGRGSADASGPPGPPTATSRSGDAATIALIDVSLEQAQTVAQAIEFGRLFVALQPEGPSQNVQSAVQEGGVR